jgi:zinc transporter ZupT
MTFAFVVAIGLAVAYLLLGVATSNPLTRESNYTRCAVWTAAAMVIAGHL